MGKREGKKNPGNSIKVPPQKEGHMVPYDTPSRSGHYEF
jgi:carboxypeptidase C (cathepsin A)